MKEGSSVWDRVTLGAFVSFMLTLVSVIGCALNSFICAVVLVNKQVKKESGCGARIFLTGLVLTGFFTDAVFLASSSMTIFNGVPLIPCEISGTAWMFLPPAAIFFITGINVDRYLAIAAPLHYSSVVLPKKVLLICFFALTLIVAMALYPLTFIEYVYVPDRLSCRANFQTPDGIVFVTIYSIVTFAIPVTIVTFCNIKGSTAARQPSTTTTLLQIGISVFVLYTPIYMQCLFDATGFEIPDQCHLIGTVLIMVSTPYNPYLYGLKNKILRRALRHYWRKKKTKNDLVLEIQARTPSRRPSITSHRVVRPSSTGVIVHTLPRVHSLRHSATSASLMIVNETIYNNPTKNQRNPTILITKPVSEDDVGISLRGRAQYTLGGSASSVSEGSDFTDYWDGAPHCGPNWNLFASSRSLPVNTPSYGDRPLSLG